MSNRPVDWDRRRFLQALTAAGMGGVLGWPVLGRYNLRLDEVDVTVAGLPPPLDGLRVALLTDIHVGMWAQPELAERAVTLANRARPHLAVLGGDLAHDDITDGELKALAAALARLQAPLGVFAVLGNHDYLAGAARVERALTDAGVPVLVNQGRVVARGLYLAGLDDGWFGRPDLAAALRGAPRGGARLLAMHEPDYADQAAAQAPSLGLQLSGHSHGGQIRLPGVGPLILPRMGVRYPLGLQKVDGADLQVYTSRGVGLTGPPVRLFCPPEVTLLRLRSPQGH